MPKGDTITTKFAIDISDLKKGITEANQQIKLANAQFKAASAGMDDWTKSADGIKAKLQQLESVLAAEKSKLKSYGDQLALLEKSYSESAKKSEELKKQLQELAASGVSKTSDEYKKLQAELTRTEKEQESSKAAADKMRVTLLNQQAAVATVEKDIGKYNGTLDDLEKEEKESVDTGKKAKEALKDIGDEAEKTDKKTGGLASTLANGLKKGLLAVGAGAVAATGSLVASTVSAGEYADAINTLSTVTGIGTDELQAYKYAADLVDVSMETLTGSMKKNLASMKQAQNGTAKYTDAYKKLGVSVTDANGNLRDSETVYWETIDALAEMEEGTERDALAMDIFGKSAQDLNPLFAKGSEGIAELTEEAKRMGAVMSQDSLNELNAFQDSMDRLKGGAAAAKNALGTLLLPMLSELADTGVSLLGEFTKGIVDAGGDWEKIVDTIGDTVENIISALAEKIPKLLEVGVEIITSLVNAIVPQLPTLVESIVKALIDLTPVLFDGAIQLFSALVAAIPDIAVALWNALPQIVDTFLNALTGPVLDLYKQMWEGVKAVWSLASGWFNDHVIQPVVGFFSDMWDKLKSGAKSTWDGIKAAFSSVGSWFKSIFSSAWEGVKKVFAPVGDFFSTTFDKMKGAIKSPLNFVIRGLNNLINGLNKIHFSIPDWVPVIGGKSFGINIGNIPELAQGGVLKKGQIGLLEGSGAEAVVPLENNRGWIRAVASDLLSELLGAQNGYSSVSNVRETTYTFNQTINAPKQPSRIEIYRQTRNLLDMAKVVSS